MVNLTFTCLHCCIPCLYTLDEHTLYQPIYMMNISILTIVVKIYKLVTFVIPINRSLTFCNQGGCRTVSTIDTLSTRCPTVLRTVPSLDTLFRDNPNSVPTG